ncbi:MAG: chromate transporter [Clostridia bacterium]
MIFLDLFWTFFKIGLFTIGGGHAMIPMIMSDVVAKGWLENKVLIDFIAISEGTPGPFAVNIATFTGMETAGVFGAMAATFGVVLPSFIVILLIVKLFSNFMKRKNVQNVFVGVRASVTGLLTAVLLSLALTVLFSVTSIFDVANAKVDFVGIGILAVLLVLSFVKIKGKRTPPILIIVMSAVLGILAYGFIPI